MLELCRCPNIYGPDCTSFPVIQTCNTFQKKLGQEQFRASNEVNWLNNDVI